MLAAQQAGIGKPVPSGPLVGFLYLEGLYILLQGLSEQVSCGFARVKLTILLGPTGKADDTSRAFWYFAPLCAAVSSAKWFEPSTIGSHEEAQSVVSVKLTILL